MPFASKFLHQRSESRIVKAFAEREIKLDAQAPVNFVKLFLRERDHLVPDFQIFLVAVLEFHQFLARGFPRPFRIGFARGVDQLVKPLHFGDGVGA